MTAISPQDWQDQEDGRALRELREALPQNGWLRLVINSDREYRIVVSRITATDYRREDIEMSPCSTTLAAAADACRAALRERAA